MSASDQTSDFRCVIDRVWAEATVPDEAGTEYLDQTKASPPARRVRRSRCNASGRVASQKTGVVQEAESHNLELAVALECEFDMRVTTYWAQPQPVSLDYQTAKGRRSRTPYTPDYLVELSDGRLAVVECKREEKVLKEIEEGNPRFELLTPSSYADPIARAALGDMGIRHLIMTEKDINTILITNYRFLGTGYLHDWKPQASTQALIGYLANVGSARIDRLVEAGNEWTSDDVYGCIACGYVYVDLQTVRLSSKEPVIVYASKAVHELFGRSSVSSSDQNTPCVRTKCPPLEAHTKSEIEAALQRWSIIRPVIDGEKRSCDLTRTQRKWLQDYRQAERVYDAGYVGLLPAYSRRGNRRSRLPKKVEVLINEHIDAYLDPSKPGATKNYGGLRRVCIEIGQTPPSRQTFSRKLRSALAEQAAIRSREGEEAAYQNEPAAPTDSGAASRSPQRAWEIGFIDHTPLPICCVTSQLKSPVSGTPRLSILRCGYTDEVLAFYLSFQNPSTTAILALLWACIRRYDRVPEWIHLDGERPHDSERVEKLLARLKSHKAGRRYQAPRDGSLVEGDFRVIQERLLQELSGHYVDDQDPKKWPKEDGPKDLAEWTIGGLYCAIDRYYADYNRQSRRAKLGGATPSQARVMSEQVHGARAFRLHDDPDQARYALLPTPQRGEERVYDPTKGIRVNYQRYVPSRPIGAAFKGRRVPVLYDPYDIRYILVQMPDVWHTFYLPNHAQYDDLSPAFLAGLSIEAIEVARQIQQCSGEKAEQLSETIEAIDELPRDPLGQFLRDQHRLSEQVDPPMHDDAWGRLDPASVQALGVRYEQEGRHE